MAILKDDHLKSVSDHESILQYHVADASDENILVPDKEVLFLGDYSRHNYDLRISHEDKIVIIEGYFNGQFFPDLVSQTGATLSFETVSALAGPLAPAQFAQSGVGNNLVKIGEVVKLAGSATSQSVEGIETELKVGSPVYQGDVVATGSESKLGITFLDKSVFSMNADARMVLDELIYDPNKPDDNSMSFNLVEGAFVFVTGEVATTGNMKIETPVATMGIRGTTPKVTVDASLGVTEFSLLPDPGSGKVGKYQLINKSTGEIMGTVASVDDKWVVTTLSDEVVKIGKSGVDLLEDSVALDEIKDLVSKTTGKKAEFKGSTTINQNQNQDLDQAEDIGSDDGGEQQEEFNPLDGEGDEDGNGFDDPPEAGNDEFATDEDSILAGGANVIDGSGGGVDIDPDGFGISVTHVNGTALNFVGGVALVVLPSGANLLITPNGDITYDANDAYDFLGLNDTDQDEFNYTVTDAGGQSDTAVVTITITGRNDQPEITALANSKHSDDFTEAPGTGILTNRTVSGIINFRDVDASDTHVVNHQLDSLVWSKSIGGTENLPEIGTLLPVLTQPAQVLNPTITFDAAGNVVARPIDVIGNVAWTYTVQEQELDFLAAGETLVATYQVSIIDDSGVGAGGGTDEADTVIQNVVVTITGTNDAPVISVEAPNNDTQTLNETDAALITSGTLTVTDVDVSNEVTASVQSITVGGNSNRLDPAAPDDAALLAMLSVTPINIIGNNATEAQLTWDFNSGGEAFNYLAGGEDLILSYTIRVVDDDPTTPLEDTHIVTITIDGTNDAPTITLAGIGDVNSADLDETDNALTANGSLTVSDVDTSNSVSASIVSLDVTGTSDRTDDAAPDDAALQAMLSLINQNVIDNTENSNQLLWNFNSGTQTFDYLATGETLILTYTVIRAIDNDLNNPLNATETVTITITGTNDAPVISLEVGDTNTSALTETDAGLIDSGTLTITDVDTTDLVTATVETVVIGANTSDATDPATPANNVLLAMMSVTPGAILDGTEKSNVLTWNFNSGTEAFDYLANGETLELIYTIQAEDDDGTPLNDTEIVTVTITGSNDAPVISLEAGDSNVSALTETNGGLTDSGTLTVTDLDTTDLVNASVETVVIGGNTSDATDPATPALNALLAMLSVTPNSILDGTENTNTLTWNFSSGVEAFDYLANGEILELIYTIQVQDDDGTPLNDTEIVTVTITGTNDAPVVSLETGDTNTSALTETNAGLTDSGTLTISDVDTTDLVSANVASVTISANTSNAADPDTPSINALLNMMSVTPPAILHGTENTDTLTWNFDSGTEAFDYLGEGEFLELIYEIQAQDNDGAPLNDTETVTVTITGTNDAPVITPIGGPFHFLSPVETDGGINQSSTLTISDIDTTDQVDVSVLSVSIAGDTSNPTDPRIPQNADLLAMLDLAPVQILDSTEQSDTLTWTFNSNGEAFDFLAQGEKLDLEYIIQAIDDAGTPLSETATLIVEITGRQDDPFISINAGDKITSSLTENNVGISDTGTVTVTDLDTTNSVSANVQSVQIGPNTTNPLDGGIPSGGNLMQLFTLTNPSVLNASQTEEKLTWNFDALKDDIDFLATGEILELIYTIRVFDGVAFDTQDVTVTITGTNDAPEISVVGANRLTAEFTENNAGLIETGTVTVTDPDTSNIVVASVEQVSVGANTSTPSNPAIPANAQLLAMLSLPVPNILDNTEKTDQLPWTFNSNGEAFDYLADGQVLELIYQIKVGDTNDSQLSDTKNLVVTINGTNDLPVISVEAGDLDSRSLTESNVPLDTTGTLTVTDPDTTNLVTATVQSVSLGTNTTNPVHVSHPSNASFLDMMGFSSHIALSDTQSSNQLNWIFDTDGVIFNYLVDGEILELVYTIRVQDGTATDDHNITITITGTNDVPAITNAITSNTSEGGASYDIDMLTGAIDLDAGETSTLNVQNVSALPDGVTRNGTTLTVDPTDASFEGLALGESTQLVINYEIVDTNGAAIAQSVTVNVAGSNDAPVVTPSLNALTYTGDVEELVLDSAIVVNDVDGTTTNGATVRISNNFVSGEDLLSFTSFGGITGVWDNVTGTLTFSHPTAPPSLADAQAVMQSVTYQNLATGARTTSVREIEFVILDDTNTASPAQTLNLTVEAGSNFQGSANDDAIAGTAFNDQLFGLDGDDILVGMDGLDLLVGGDGADSLRGDAPGGTSFADVFKFLNDTDGTLEVDTILDFDITEDTINLADFLDGSTAAHADTAISVVASGATDTMLQVNGEDVVLLENVGIGQGINVVYDDLENSIIVNNGGLI